MLPDNTGYIRYPSMAIL